MPPRTRNPKALKASRGAATPSHSANVPTSYPWPNKAEGQPININDPLLLDYNCEGWDKESAARYNRLLAADILPTRFAHAETLAVLGLESDVFETLDVMGLAPLCYQAQVLYPDLVRQVLATAQITYQNPTAPTYENCYFSFMADGKFCSISLHDLNELLEIADTPREVSVDKKFAPANAFWDLIATGKFTSRKAYQSQIRNPTLRIIAKIVSNILFAKEHTSKVTNGELGSTPAREEMSVETRVIPIQTVKTNPGFLLITMLSERKDSMVPNGDKKDRWAVLSHPCSNASTSPGFPTVVPELEYIDTAYLITCHILRDESTYKFADKDGIILYCKLPLPGLTDFTTLDNIVFLPNAEHLSGAEEDLNGLPAEIPMDHIEKLEKMCGSLRRWSTTDHQVYLVPFLSRWEGCSLARFPTNWIAHTWEQVRSAFLSHFYTKSKTAALRHEDRHL
ncbi:uncharacterized protein LOC117132681 [Brassica rapa]|uniref:uncharacterized protein LOC117132681 n=1 Tax=Brassica campestris TaxID=3711 RepID=UPI00142E30C0|nr:uncharacterized protein LOC117132681 [Brassica rapa]